MEARAVGMRIRRRRRELGLSLAALGREVGATRGHLSNVERGRDAPSLGLLCRLAEALGCSPAELLGDERGGGACDQGGAERA